MGRSPLPAILLPVLLAGCGTTMDGVTEFFGGSRPGLHARRLDALHEPREFAHRPDTPDALGECLEEVLELGRAEYDDSRDGAGAAFLLARVATEDSAALHRAGACRALGRLGGILAPVDPPAGAPLPEGEAAAALQRLREIHRAAEGPGHADGGAVLECAALFRRLGEFRIPLVGDPGPVGFGRDLRTLRGTLAGVLAESRDEEGVPEGALRSLGFQVARTALAGTILHDGDPRVRGEAAMAAGTFGGADMAELLRTAYAAEQDAGARRAVVAAAAAVALRLPNRERSAAATLLLAALEDDDRGIRFEAREGMKGLAGEDLGERPGPWLRWWAGERDRP